MFCITLDKHNNESSREEKLDGYRPKNGFELRQDGNYYKQLGDPRNISDIEKSNFLQNAFSNNNSSTDNTQVIKDLLPVIHSGKPADSIQRVLEKSNRYRSAIEIYRNTGAKIILVDTPLSMERIKFYSYGGVWTKDNDNNTVILETTMLDKCGIDYFASQMSFSKMLLNPWTKNIKIWEFNGSKEHPDVILVDAMQ